MSELNRDLLRTLIEWAAISDKGIPDPRFIEWGEWNQGYWFVMQEGNPPGHVPASCGTAFCIAGQMANLDGLKILVYADGHADAEVLTESGIEFIDEYAAERLGITSVQADALFDGRNSIEDLMRVADAICEEEGYSPISGEILANLSVSTEVNQGEV